jgi:hypothetical protein
LKCRQIDQAFNLFPSKKSETWFSTSSGFYFIYFTKFLSPEEKHDKINTICGDNLSIIVIADISKKYNWI